MNTFKIFLASSGSLKEERAQVEIFVSRENERLESMGLSLKLVVWEKLLQAFRKERIQDYFNEQMLACDMVIVLIFDKVGQFTLEEFNKAHENLKKGNKPLYLYVYFKKAALDIDAIDGNEINKIRALKNTINEYEQIYCSYDSIADLINQIRAQLDKIIIERKFIEQNANEKHSQTIPKAVQCDFSRYKEYALTEHRHLAFKGFESTLRVPINIEQVYVTLHAQIHGKEFCCDTVEGRKGFEAWTHEQDMKRFDMRGAFAAALRQCVKDMIILGDPGSGKTTLLKYILIMIIEGKALHTLGISSGLIPFFAPLRELKNPDAEDFNSFIKRVCCLESYSITDEIFTNLLENKQGIILFDGLDEVADKNTRLKVCRWIDKARRNYVHTPFIITSRFAGYTQESRLEGSVLELVIQDFTPEEVRTFLIKWFKTVEVALNPGKEERLCEEKGEKEAKELADNINQSEHIKKLAVNPLMLQIIALIRRDRGTALPQRRVELYKECISVLLEKWDMAKGLNSLISAAEVRLILQPVALWLHEKEERRSAPLPDIIEIIKKPLSNFGKTIDPKQLLLNIRDRSGIFMGYNETEYGFAHLSFQEYLAAEEIRNKVTRDNNEIEILIKNYSIRWWREAILLCLGLDNPSILDKFIERIVFTKDFETEPTIVNDALKDAVSKPFDTLLGLLKNKKLSDKAKEQIQRILRQFGKEDELKRAGVMPEIIIKPDKPEKILHKKDNSEMVLIPAGSFLYGSKVDDKEAQSNEKPQVLIDLPAFYMDIYPTTNEQYCRFLNDAQPDANKLGGWFYFKDSYEKEKCRILKDKNRYAIESGFERNPVSFVNWFGAKAYADWAEKILPTEKQWEKAARGTDGRRYPWGNDFEEGRCNYGRKHKGTTPVNKYEQGESPYGCYDMAGNVWEWTCTNYKTEKEQDDFKSDEWIVLRGGSWYDDAEYCRCAYRYHDFPGLRGYYRGFRCARITL